MLCKNLPPYIKHEENQSAADFCFVKEPHRYCC